MLMELGACQWEWCKKRDGGLWFGLWVILTHPIGNTRLAVTEAIGVGKGSIRWPPSSQSGS